MRRIALPFALILGLAGAAVAQDVSGGAQQLPREIIVTGQGVADVVPDTAIVTAGVESQADTAAAALEANAGAMRDVLAALEAAEIEARDIQTSNLALTPVYRPGENGAWSAEVIGYIARNMVTVRVREVAHVGDVLDSMSEAGINRIDSISFSVAETRPHLDAARRDAVADARAKAELLAEAAGVRLGKVVNIRETQPVDQPFPMMMRAEAAGMGGAISEGSIELSAMVEIVFEIEDQRDGGTE